MRNEHLRRARRLGYRQVTVAEAGPRAMRFAVSHFVLLPQRYSSVVE